MYNQDPRMLGDLYYTWDPSIKNQINATINIGRDAFQITKYPGGSLNVTTLDRLGMASKWVYSKKKGDGSVQYALQWFRDNSQRGIPPGSGDPPIISQAQYNDWMGYLDAYFTALWYKNNPGQPIPPGGVPKPNLTTQGNILDQIIAWFKGQGTPGTGTTPATTNAGFLGTYGIPIIALVGGIAILGFAFAPKKGGAPATVPLVKPVIRYRSWPKKRRK